MKHDCQESERGFVEVRTQSEAEINHAIAMQSGAVAKDTVDRVSRAVEALASARLVFENDASWWHSHWSDWVKETDKYIVDVRQFRQALSMEHTQAIKSVNDIREFLGTPDFAKSMAQLRELVELGERASKLKASGILDAIVDTLLKVEAHG